MNEAPHFLRLARALALGAAAVATAACTSASTTENGTANTTSASSTTATSAGDEQPAAQPDAGATVVANTEPAASPSDGAPCAQVGEHRFADNPTGASRVSCTCHTADGGAAQWSCAEMPMRIMGPAAPPELAA